MRSTRILSAVRDISTKLTGLDGNFSVGSFAVMSVVRSGTCSVSVPNTFQVCLSAEDGRKFRSEMKQCLNCRFAFLNFYFWVWDTARRKILNWVVASRPTLQLVVEDSAELDSDKNAKYLPLFRRCRKLVKSDYYLLNICPSVHPSVRMEQLSSHGTGFHEIWYNCCSRKSAEKIQISLKSNKSNGYFTWRPLYVFDHISLSYS
jgi:hypothetical protein